jgi:peptidoglycan/xylan/chitin deacetylase (PgdA/CDA1 family)
VPYILRETIQRKRVTILMFHEVTASALDSHIRVLSKRYNLVSLDSYLQAVEEPSIARLPEKALIMTIDDGIQGNYELLPVIKKRKVPITIFICSGIVDTCRHFWFMCGQGNNELERLKRISDEDRLEELKVWGFCETKEYADRQSLSGDELREMQDFVNFEAHTVYHPILPMCGDEKAFFEIRNCKVDLKNRFGLLVHSLSYPNGDYGEREVRLAKKCGYRCAVTTNYGFNTSKSDPFRLKRIYVDDKASTDELIVKASGFWIPFHWIDKHIKRYIKKRC